MFLFVSPYEPGEEEIGEHVKQHGDGVKDVAFAVEDLDNIVKVRTEWIMLYPLVRGFLDCA